MSNSLPEYLAQHEELRQSLLAQEGGILKFLAEHLDAKDTDSLFRANVWKSFMKETNGT